jgi:hypothetical protein
MMTRYSEEYKKKLDQDIVFRIFNELNLAKKYPSFHSLHEGYAVLLEEVDELWDCVRLNQKKRDYELIEKECIQIASMAIRIIKDCCQKNGEGFKK